MNDKTTFRDQLLAVEPVATDAREKLLQEFRDMLIRKLTGPHKVLIVGVMLFSLAVAGLCAYLAITVGRLPVMARIGLGSGTLFGLAWVALSIAVLRRGSLDMLSDQRRMAQLVWGFTLLLVICLTIVGLSAPDPVKGLPMVAKARVFLISAGFYWITFFIQQPELNMKERLLRLELQLTELSQRGQG